MYRIAVANWGNRGITSEDKSLIDKVKPIIQLEPDEKNMVFKMIDTFLTKKKVKDFFQKNVAAL